MIMTVVAFFILQLHYHGFDPVLLICRPFQRMFARFRQGWNLHTSLIDAFITFFILSTTNILHVSISILLSVQLRGAEGSNLGHYWYEVAFFSSIHKPYAILAISVLLLFIILPMWATSSPAVKYVSLRPGSRDVCWRSLCTHSTSTIRTEVVELGTVGGLQPFI